MTGAGVGVVAGGAGVGVVGNGLASGVGEAVLAGSALNVSSSSGSGTGRAANSIPISSNAAARFSI